MMIEGSTIYDVKRCATCDRAVAVELENRRMFVLDTYTVTAGHLRICATCTPDAAESDTESDVEGETYLASTWIKPQRQGA